MEYIIVGDTERYTSCLVSVGYQTIEDAEQAINRMLNNPTENDKRVIEGHINLRVKPVNSEDCWWNYCTD